MLKQEELDRVVVVLVRARNAKNIGAVARAMHDFGFRHLRVVNEYAVPLETARSAVDASAVIAAATVCADVAEAVADCTLVVGTTAVGERVLQHPLQALPDGAAKMLEHLAGQQLAQGASGRVALLFGSEKTGLSNEELSHCHWLLTIPMQEHEDVRHASMNLGQAVAVCLYELVRGRGLDVATRPFQPLSQEAMAASANQVERIAKMMDELLEAGGYKQHHPANSGLEDIRRLIVRMNLNTTDAPVWMGMLRQLLWRIAQTNGQ